MLQFENAVPQGVYVDRSSFTGLSVLTSARYGISSRVELRAATSLIDGYIISDNSDFELGFETLALGAKIGLGDGAGGGLVASLTPELSVPLSGGLTGISATGAVGFPLGETLGGNFTLSLSSSTQSVADDLSALLAGALSHSFSPALAGYAEAALVAMPGEDPIFVGGGLLFLVSPDLQLDAALDVGLNDAAPDLMFGFGVSFRL